MAATPIKTPTRTADERKEPAQARPRVVCLEVSLAASCPAGLVAHLAREEGPVVLILDGLPDIHAGRLGAVDEATLEATLMACAASAARLGAKLSQRGLPSLSVSGIDLGLMRSACLNHEKLGWRGGPPRIDTGVLQALLSCARVLTVSPLALGPEGPLVIAPDTLAHALAVALGTPVLEFLVEDEGLRTLAGQRLGQLTAPEAQALVRAGDVARRRIPTVQAALAALAHGVERVRIGSLAALQGGAATELRA